MDLEKINRISAYFKRIEHIRGGDYMSELKRQYVIFLKKKGLSNKQINNFVHIKHDKVWHYLNRMKQNDDIGRIIRENMHDWIDQGLYPVPKMNYFTGKTDMTLHVDPEYKYRVPKKSKEDDFRRLISLLGD